MGRTLYFFKTNGKLIISSYMLPEYETQEVPKYNGKEARILAIKEVAGIEISEALTVREIKYTITENIYNTPIWGKYRTRYFQLLNEKNKVDVKNEFLGSAVVPIQTGIVLNTKIS